MGMADGNKDVLCVCLAHRGNLGFRVRVQYRL